MPDYTKAKIYKIVGEDGSTYYGSTTEKYINNRLAKHRFTTSTAYTKIMSQMEFSIEEFPCSSKQELEDREAYYIRNYECVNKIIPNRTMKQYYKENRDIYVKLMNKRYHFINSWGGDPRSQNNLLQIDINIFA